MHKKVQRIKLIIQTSQKLNELSMTKSIVFTVLNAYFLFVKIGTKCFIYLLRPRVTLTHVLQAIGSDINYPWKVLIVNKSF